MKKWGGKKISMHSIIEYFTFKYVWGVEIIFARICIIAIAYALIYSSQYRMYKSIRKDSGEAAEKWLSPILFALIIFAVEYILDVFAMISDDLFVGFDPYIFIIHAEWLVIPILAILIYRRHYKKYVEGKIRESAKGKFLTPHHFGILIVLIEGVVVFAYVVYGTWMSV